MFYFNSPVGRRYFEAAAKQTTNLASINATELRECPVPIPPLAEQKRIIAATVKGVRLVCAYIPNGSEVGSEKYEYKLRWLTALTAWLKDELVSHPQLALLGDYNIAPDDRDVHDPAAWQDKILCSAPERAAFQGLLDLGLKDSFRLFEQAEQSFSWWDYRAAGFRRNLGLRIDHILLSSPLVQRCTASTIDKAPRKLERPSDHAPVMVDLADSAS